MKARIVLLAVVLGVVLLAGALGDSPWPPIHF
jgi:outer membrane murein-binding lipoprotein Lpp